MGGVHHRGAVRPPPGRFPPRVLCPCKFALDSPTRLSDLGFAFRTTTSQRARVVQNESLNAVTSATYRESAAIANRYWLAKHVQLCVVHDHVVMLDLLRDKYLAVASPEELAPWVAGWPVASDPIAGASGTSVARASSVDLPIPGSLSRLVRDGLLTSDAASGKPANPTTIPRPRSALVQFQFGVRPRVKSIYAVAVGRAWLTARIARRRLSMQRLVERVQERKARAAHRSWDAQQARDLATAFFWLRPLYYSSRGACLLDSLVLLELLAHHGLYPTWVFGVRLSPFGAHCWVQHGDVVWNDTPEHASSYTPIMGV